MTCHADFQEESLFSCQQNIYTERSTVHFIYGNIGHDFAHDGAQTFDVLSVTLNGRPLLPCTLMKRAQSLFKCLKYTVFF